MGVRKVITCCSITKTPLTSTLRANQGSMRNGMTASGSPATMTSRVLASSMVMSAPLLPTPTINTGPSGSWLGVR